MWIYMQHNIEFDFIWDLGINIASLLFVNTKGLVL